MSLTWPNYLKERSLLFLIIPCKREVSCLSGEFCIWSTRLSIHLIVATDLFWILKWLFWMYRQYMTVWKTQGRSLFITLFRVTLLRLNVSNVFYWFLRLLSKNLKVHQNCNLTCDHFFGSWMPQYTVCKKYFVRLFDTTQNRIIRVALVESQICPDVWYKNYSWLRKEK